MIVSGLAWQLQAFSGLLNSVPSSVLDRFMRDVTTSLRVPCAPNVLNYVVVSVPRMPWWLDMLRIFVPVASALGLALLGYRFTLRSGPRSRRAQARPTIQCQLMDDVQQALKTFWVVAGQLLRVPQGECFQRREQLSALVEASVAATIGTFPAAGSPFSGR